MLQSSDGILAWLPGQAKEARQEREAHVAQAQMEAALSAGVSWGMAEDARASDDDGVTHGFMRSWPPETAPCAGQHDAHGGLMRMQRS